MSQGLTSKYLILDPSMAWLQVALNIVAKFSVSMCFFVSSLQALEVYPTCVRQGGFTFGLVAGNIFSIFAPYIVYSVSQQLYTTHRITRSSKKNKTK